MSLICDGVDECIKGTRYAILKGADFVQIRANSGSCFNPHELKAIVDTAAEVDKHVSIHTENDRIAERAITAGVKTIDHATGIQDRTVDLGNQAGVVFISTLIPLKAILTHGPKANRSQKELGWANRFLYSSCETYKKIRKLGGTMAIGTDYGAENPYQGTREQRHRA